MHHVVAVKACGKYRLWIRFDDGTEGEVDLSDFAGKGVFAAWNQSGEFERVYVDTNTHTAAWPGGIDLCPNRLYEDVKAQADVPCVRDRRPD
jgi:hypothetical protein